MRARQPRRPHSRRIRGLEHVYLILVLPHLQPRTAPGSAAAPPAAEAGSGVDVVVVVVVVPLPCGARTSRGISLLDFGLCKAAEVLICS